MPRDEELLAQAKAGDQSAVERLLLGIHGRVRSAIEPRIPTRLRSLLNVDDVLQDAYVAVFRRIARFESRGDDAFFAWVVRIAETRLLDAIKSEATAKRGGDRRRVEPVYPETAEPTAWLELLSMHERTPSRSAAMHEAVKLVQDALSALSADHQQALRLRYIEGLPVAEAAKRMDRTEGAICLLCHRGLKHLRESLGSSEQFFLSRK